MLPNNLYLVKHFACAIVTTPNQPQLNSKVWVYMKMTLHHPPHKLNALHISAVPDPILSKL